MKLKSIIFISILFIILPNVVFSSSNTTNIYGAIDDSINPLEVIEIYDIYMDGGCSVEKVNLSRCDASPFCITSRDSAGNGVISMEWIPLKDVVLPFKKNNSLKNISDNICLFFLGCIILVIYILSVIFSFMQKYLGIVILIGIIILGGIVFCK